MVTLSGHRHPQLAGEIGADTTKAYEYFGRGKTAQVLAQSIENVVRGTDQAADEVLKKNSGRYLDEIRRQEAGWTR